MQFSHEIIVPEAGYPFKIFLFEGGSGNYYRETLDRVLAQVG